MRGRLRSRLLVGVSYRMYPGAGGGGDGGTPPIPQLIYSPSNSQFEVANISDYTTPSFVWVSETGTIDGQTGATLALADAPAGEAVYVVINGYLLSNWAYTNLDTTTVYASLDFSTIEDGTHISGGRARFPSWANWGVPTAGVTTPYDFVGPAIQLKDVVPGSSSTAKAFELQGYYPTAAGTNTTPNATNSKINDDFIVSGGVLTLPRQTGDYQGFIPFQGSFSSDYSVEWTCDPSVFTSSTYGMVLMLLGKVTTAPDNNTAGEGQSYGMQWNIRNGNMVLRRKGYGDSGTIQVAYTASGSTVFRAEVNWTTGYIKLFVNGSEVEDATGYVKGTGALINSVSGTPLTQAGTAPGFPGKRDDYGPAADGRALGTKWEVKSIVPSVFSLTTNSTSVPTRDNPSVTDVGFVYSGSPTAIDWVLLDTDHRLIGSWVNNVSVTGGTGSISFSAQAHWGRARLIGIRDHSDHSQFSVLDLGTIPVYERVDPVTFGVNSGFINRYSPGREMRNQAQVAGIYYADSTGVLADILATVDDKNAVTALPPAGYDTLWYNLFENSKYNPDDGVEWTFTSPVPVTTLSFGKDSGGWTTGITSPTQVDTTHATCMMVEDSSSWVIGMRVRGLTSIPAGGYLPVFKPTDDGDADATHLSNPKVTADFNTTVVGNPSGDFIFRDVHFSGVEQNSGTYPTYARGCTPEYAASKVAQAGVKNFWHCIPWYEDFATVVAWVVRFRDACLSRGVTGWKLWVECFNELWNDGYALQRWMTIGRAFQEGHWTEGSIPTGATVIQGAMDVNGVAPLVTRSTYTIVRDVAAGTWIPCQVDRSSVGGGTYSWMVYQCLADATAGEVLPLTSTPTSKFQAVLIDDATTMTTVLKRYQAQRQFDLCQLLKATFGSDHIVSVFGVSPNDSGTQRAQAVLYNNCYTGIDYLATTWYSGSGATYASLYAADSAWGSTGSTFKTVFYAKRHAATTALIALQVGAKHSFAQAMFTLGGVLPEDCPIHCVYEAGDHNVVTSPPAEERDRLVAEFQSAKDDPLEKDEWDYQLGEFANQFGGPIVIHDDYEPAFYNFGGAGQIQAFGLAKSPEGDHSTDQGYQSLLEQVALL